MLTTKQIIFVTANGLIAPVCIIVSILGCVKLYHRRNEMYIKKRNINVIWISLLFIFLAEIGSFILSILFIIFRENFFLFGTTFCHVLLCFVFMALIPINYFKFYLYNFNNAIKKYQWSSIIVGNKAKNNWFIKNKQTFGEWSYIGKYIILSIIMNCVCAVIGNYIAVDCVLKGNKVLALIGASMTTPFTNIPIIVLILINKHTKYDDKDSFYFKGEQRLHLKVFKMLLVFLFLSGIYVCIVAVLGETILEVCLDMCVYTGIGFGVKNCGLILASTFGVISNNETRVQYESPKGLTLNAVFKNKSELKLFVEHIITELSVELVTAYIEINQYLLYIGSLSGINVDDIGTYNPYICIYRNFKNILIHDLELFYENIPRSQIVYGNHDDIIYKDYISSELLTDELLFVKLKGYMLYEKYIQEFSTFQVNIPYEQRNKFDQLMGDSLEQWFNMNITYKEIYILFKTPLKELKKLMKFSFFRYKAL